MYNVYFFFLCNLQFHLLDSLNVLLFWNSYERKKKRNPIKNTLLLHIEEKKNAKNEYTHTKKSTVNWNTGYERNKGIALFWTAKKKTNVAYHFCEVYVNDFKNAITESHRGKIIWNQCRQN